MRDRLSCRDSGVSAVVVALCLTLLGAFLALGLNTGHLFSVRGELQNAVDAAALAAVKDLDGTLAGTQKATATAASYALRHRTDQATVNLASNGSDVVFGHWNPGTKLLTPLIPSATTAAQIDTVRVRTALESARGNAFQVIVAPLLGKSSVDLGAGATATRLAPCQESCVVPIVLSQTQLYDNQGVLLCQTHTFGPHNDIMLGVPVSFGGANNNTFRAALTGTCPKAAVNDRMNLQNGVDLNPPLVNAFNAFIAAHGAVVSVPVVNAQSVIVGFARLQITSVQKKEIDGTLQCNVVDPNGSQAGCTAFGAVLPDPVVVQ